MLDVLSVICDIMLYVEYFQRTIWNRFQIVTSFTLLHFRSLSTSVYIFQRTLTSRTPLFK